MHVIMNDNIPVAAFYNYEDAELYVHNNHLSITDIYVVDVE